MVLPMSTGLARIQASNARDHLAGKAPLVGHQVVDQHLINRFLLDLAHLLEHLDFVIRQRVGHALLAIECVCLDEAGTALAVIVEQASVAKVAAQQVAGIIGAEQFTGWVSTSNATVLCFSSVFSVSLWFN